jgi:phenylalanyl-tRNA synthetase beta chain
MKVSYNWLCSMLPSLDASPAEVGERLTRSGLELEELIEYGSASPSCLVAEVAKTEKHPERDRLTLVTVNRGGGQQTVVCGANNVPATGGRVVLAPLGAHLPAAGLTVAARKIGGIESEGMLCSEGELGLVGGAGKGDGIMVLSKKLTVGASFDKAVPGTHDWILDLGVTPNRPDALGHVGVAREVAALFDLEFAAPEADAPAKVKTGTAIDKHISVVIDDTERCPHYGATLVVDLTVGPSPDWLRYRLESLGVRAISNLVDVTNLVMLEFGQPMHAFDLDKLPGGKIVVRRARDGEVMTTLDGVERKLVSDDLVITDGERPIALAGVMGGANTEISGSATRVLLECAYFMPRGVRRTARRHGLHSESSHRFERGCDPQALPTVLPHAASLVTRLCDGSAIPGAIIAGVAPAARKQIRLRRSKMHSLLGMKVDLERASALLHRLGCDVTRSAEREDELDVAAPSFRPDLTREEDLIEEVMRIQGIDEVPTTARAVLPKAGRSIPTTEQRTRSAAAQLGLSEALTFGFLSPPQLAALSADTAAVVLKNPLTEDRSVMRTTLLPGLLEVLRRARRHGVADVRLFVVGRTFHQSDGPLPQERIGFAAVIAGTRQVGLGKPEPLDVYDAKGVALELAARVTSRPARVESLAPEEAPYLHPRGIGGVFIGDDRVGTFGPLHPRVTDELDLDGPALVIELSVDALRDVGRDTPQYKPIPMLPPLTRDVALLVDETVTSGALASTITQSAGELCESVEVFDRFQGKGVPDGQQSLAFHIVFRDPKAATDPDNARTLTDKEVDALAKKVVDAVSEQYNASVR